MTIDDVLAEVARLDGWFVTRTGRLRRKTVDGYDACPLITLAHRRPLPATLDLENSNFAVVGRYLGLPHEETLLVVNAADGRFPDTDGVVPLRERLLNAARVTEQPIEERTLWP